jgi:hypothetical protein
VPVIGRVRVSGGGSGRYMVSSEGRVVGETLRECIRWLEALLHDRMPRAESKDHLAQSAERA